MAKKIVFKPVRVADYGIMSLKDVQSKMKQYIKQQTGQDRKISLGNVAYLISNPQTNQNRPEISLKDLLKHSKKCRKK